MNAHHHPIDRYRVAIIAVCILTAPTAQGCSSSHRSDAGAGERSDAGTDDGGSQEAHDAGPIEHEPGWGEAHVVGPDEEPRSLTIAWNGSEALAGWVRTDIASGPTTSTKPPELLLVLLDETGRVTTVLEPPKLEQWSYAVKAWPQSNGFVIAVPDDRATLHSFRVDRDGVVPLETVPAESTLLEVSGPLALAQLPSVVSDEATFAVAASDARVWHWRDLAKLDPGIGPTIAWAEDVGLFVYLARSGCLFGQVLNEAAENVGNLSMLACLKPASTNTDDMDFDGAPQLWAISRSTFLMLTSANSGGLARNSRCRLDKVTVDGAGVPSVEGVWETSKRCAFGSLGGAWAAPYLLLVQPNVSDPYKVSLARFDESGIAQDTSAFDLADLTLAPEMTTRLALTATGPERWLMLYTSADGVIARTLYGGP